jgi:HK97 family phage major capsid protein
MNEKELVENRNAKFEEMQNILNLAKSENRTVTDEEQAKFENLEKEIASIDNTIAMNERVNKMEMKEVKDTVVETVENKEVKMFENAIRGIVNADTPTTKADGQVTIPTSIAQKIIDKVVEISPIYQLAERYNVKGKLVLPKYDAENSSIAMTYATEGTDVESGNVKFASIELNGFLASCLAKVSNTLINNSAFDIVEFVINKMAQAIALFIEKELIAPTTAKIKGLSNVALKVTSASATAITSDELIDVQDKVVDNFQGNAIWVMNRATRNVVRKLKDGQGNYLLQKDFTAKWGYTLLGKDVYTTDGISEIKAGATPVLYGDFSGLAVKVSEDINMQILREKFATQHMTGILAFLEFDADVQDTQKIAKLEMKSGS